MSFCHTTLQNGANLMVQSIVPSDDTKSLQGDTENIVNVRAQYNSFSGSPGRNAPEESKYHFVNINYVTVKWKLLHGEDQIHAHRNEPRARSPWINSC